ncbi:hypothetical protein D3C78_1610170 [compost metagenome]
MDVLVEGVFLLEELAVQAVAVLVAVVQRADVTAGAEGLFTGAAQDHGDDLRVVGPGLQLPVKQADHRQGQGVQPGRTVEGQVADAVAHRGQYGGFAHASASLR